MKRKEMLAFIDNSSYYLREIVSENLLYKRIDKNAAGEMNSLISIMHDLMTDFLYENYTEDGELIDY